MNTALDHFRPVRLPTLIELLGADVACSLRFADSGKPADAGRTCELLLANKAKVPVSVRLFGVDRRNRTRVFGELSVASNGLGSSVFILPSGAAACERIYMEVVGDGIRLCADARMISKRRVPVVPTVAAAAAIVAIGAAAAIATLLIQFPMISAFGVPRVASPGNVVAMYATSGAGSATFAATASGGALLGSGFLPTAAGSFSVAVPAAMAGQNVNVSLDVRGPLGHAHRDVTFAVAAAPAVAPKAAPAVARVKPQPRIAYFTAHRETYAGTATILASYQASGERGVLRVRNARGAIVGNRDFSHVGTTRIPLYGDTSGQTLRAEIEVFAAGSRSTSAVEVPAAGAGEAGNVTAAAQNAAGDAGGSLPMPGDPFVVTQRVFAGRSFTIGIQHPLPNLRIALQTTSGTTIDEIAVPQGARRVTLRAPQSTMVEIYYLSGTFTRLSAEETLIRSLRIFPG